MQNHRIRFSSKDDVRSKKSHYTNVSNSISDNVELSLEVELDDEVRNIIKNPEKCLSALLDVTVIKPKGLDQYTSKTQTLKTNQVKKLIESVKLDEDDKKKLMHKLFGSEQHTKKKPKSCLSSKSKTKQSKETLEHGDVCDYVNRNHFAMYNQQQNPLQLTKSTIQQIYAAPKIRANIREIFECKNKHRRREDHGKMPEPCPCQNCAIVGILTDSQKLPFSNIPIPANHVEEKFNREKESKLRDSFGRRKSVSFKHTDELPSSSGSHEQCQAIFKMLTARIIDLEQRVVRQEERAVPKDYFKQIINKLVNHLSKLTHYTAEERNRNSKYVSNISNNDKNYNKEERNNKEYPSSSINRQYTNEERNKRSSYSDKDKHNRYNKYHINPVLIDNIPKFMAEKEYEPSVSFVEEPTRGTTDSIWKWGEDIWSSGRDLKNKVVLLLEETLQNLKKGLGKTPNTQRVHSDDIQLIVDELSKNLAKTINKPKMERKSANHLLFQNARETPGINVAYVNPKLTRWPEDSTVSFKIESDYESQRGTTNMSEAKKRQYKKEFLRVLQNTKTTDKYKLWQNIWNQALENRQTKNDIVTIQIPDPKDLLHQKMISLEYTVGELERLLIQNHK
ncbi:unnamed protein product [Ceutorhynchus assimilis]|uniref:Uncharacterized protein n=1 Tax=Ceutorhynchus assimilis TaxID=467358 RepID=A0A9N9QS42_9CUCU|nr:unnamed protein product [Ceutorhynchus assimilis]